MSGLAEVADVAPQPVEQTAQRLELVGAEGPPTGAG